MNSHFFFKKNDNLAKARARLKRDAGRGGVC